MAKSFNSDVKTSQELYNLLSRCLDGVIYPYRTIKGRDCFRLLDNGRNPIANISIGLIERHRSKDQDGKFRFLLTINKDRTFTVEDMSKDFVPISSHFKSLVHNR